MVKRTLKNRKLKLSKRKSNGGGWGDGPNFVNPGNLIHNPYTGIGKDCTGNPASIRPGYIADYTAKGLPGLSGGKRRNKNRKSRGGSNNDYPVTNPNLPPVSGSVTPKPDYFPDTTGVGGTVAHPVTMSMPGVPTTDAKMSQKGGRYGFFPEMGPLNPSNGVGVSPAPFGRIPCEAGTYNPLNLNPNDIQRMTTAPAVPPYVSRGGASIPADSGLTASSANFPTVQVGQADSMRYYAPTAGYTNDFMTFRAPSPVPGLTIQTPYDARAFNQACIKTGGGSVASNAGTFTPVKIDEIMTRKNFDGTDKGLPVKFGGKRRSKKNKTIKKRKSNNYRKTYRK